MKPYSLGSVVRAGSWGVVLGGAAGFLLGMLLAPEEGQKIRRRIVYQLEHLTEEITELIDRVLRPQEAGEARRTGDALVADARAQAQRIRDEIDALLGEMRKQGSSEPSSRAD